MTLPEALHAVRQAGAHLVLDDRGPLLRGRVAAGAVAVLRENRDRVAAILKLRAIHAAMGLAPEDVLFVEEALLSGRDLEVRIVVRPPVGTPA